MEQRYPNLQLIYGNEYYGYYTNKTQKHEKAYVLYADESYYDLVESCCRSIRNHSNYPILAYMLNSDKKVSIINTITLRWDCDVKNYAKRKDYIDRTDKNIYKLLIERPKITKDALTNYAETIAYIDTDSVASPYVDRIFDFYDYDSTYPYFVEGVYDYLHINGRGGADSRDDLSTTLEHPACDLFGINQYVRERYRQTGYYVAGQKTIEFLDEWYWMCNHPAILNNFQWYAPYHEETIMNVLLYKKFAFNGLPCMYVNGLHDNLEFTGEARIDGHWLRIPAKKEDLLFYHGEKDIDKINAFINGEKKMRILYLAPHLSTGGMPQFLLKRIEALKDYTDCEIYVVEYQCYSLDFVVQRDKIKSLLLENFTTLFEDKMELFKIIEQWNPDIIHIDEPSERLDREMVKKLYSPNRKYRIVETCHDVSFEPNNEKIFHPDSYIFCSPYHEQTFANMESKFVTIEYPIDKQDNFRMRNARSVLNVGLWTPGKNQAEGIEIAKKYPDYIFNFIGNQAGNFKEYWEPLMKDLPPNVKVWGERNDIGAWMETANIFMFNSTWECNPLVLREAISYGLPIIARNLPQYGDMFTKYLQPIDTDLNTIEANYEVPTNNTTPIFAFRQEDAYKRIIELPIQKQKASVSQHFVDNPFLEIKSSVDANYTVEFYDEYKLIYSNTIKSNSWVRLNRTYFTNWTTKVWEGNELIYENTLCLKDKRVFIVIESKSLGDTLAWIPYALEFQKKHNCTVICSTFWNKILDYPELELVEPGVVVNNIYALYRLGWFYNSDKEPEVPNTIPLQKAATNILGLEFEEIRPMLKLEKRRKLGNKYVTIATNSTAGCKFWTREGWQELINYLYNKGYGVINVSKEDNPFDNCTKIYDTSIENTIDVILHSELFIGLSSGLSWLAWALRKKVIMISNFTAADHEFQLDCIRITNTNVCNSCWNEEGIIFDKGDWNWCKHKGTEKHFECHKSITAEMVIFQLPKELV
jgi:autotransporter strand-loop-strand O-heptosyltransferase